MFPIVLSRSFIVEWKKPPDSEIFRTVWSVSTHGANEERSGSSNPEEVHPYPGLRACDRIHKFSNRLMPWRDESTYTTVVFSFFIHRFPGFQIQDFFVDCFYHVSPGNRHGGHQGNSAHPPQLTGLADTLLVSMFIY